MNPDAVSSLALTANAMAASWCGSNTTGGAASPYSGSWRSTDVDKEASMSVPFLHLWLPPRQATNAALVKAQAPADATGATAAAADDAVRVVEDAQPGGDAVPAHSDTILCDGERVAENGSVRHQRPAPSLHHHHHHEHEGASPPSPSVKSTCSELDASQSFPFSASFLVSHTAAPSHNDGGPTGRHASLSLSSSPDVAATTMAAQHATTAAAAAVASASSSSYSAASASTAARRRSGVVPSDESVLHATTSGGDADVGKEDGQLDSAVTHASWLREPAAHKEKFVGAAGRVPHPLTAFTSTAVATQPAGRASSLGSASDDAGFKTAAGVTLLHVPRITTSKATTANGTGNVFDLSVLVHMSAMVATMARSGDCSSNDVTSTCVVNQPLPSATPPAIGGLPATSSVTCMELAAMVDAGVTLRSCSRSQSVASSCSGDWDVTRQLALDELTATPPTTPPLPAMAPHARVQQAPQGLRNTYKNDVNVTGAAAVKFTQTQREPATARQRSSCSRRRKIGAPTTRRTSSLPAPRAKSTTTSTMQEPAMKPSRYQPRTREEERELAELHSSLAAFVFPPPSPSQVHLSLLPGSLQRLRSTQRSTLNTPAAATKMAAPETRQKPGKGAAEKMQSNATGVTHKAASTTSEVTPLDTRAGNTIRALYRTR